jgi:RNA polymerase sigma factor (TIGR02999 family)
MESSSTVSDLLPRVAAGDGDAFDRLFEVVYPELRRIARGQLRRWNRPADGTVYHTTVLVHEAYLKLAGADSPAWEHRSHFYAVAARAMRQILIDHARRVGAQKRGGEFERVTLDDAERLLDSPDGGTGFELAETLLSLNRSLERLEAESEQHSRIVECRFFGGMTIPETASALGVSEATVKRGWSVARTWLFREMKDEMG